MPSLLISLFLLNAAVPTGAGPQFRTPDQICPLEALPPSIELVSSASVPGLDGNTVAIFASPAVMSALGAQVSQLQADLLSEGWNASTNVMAGGTVEDLKNILLTFPDLDGVIIIGFLPCAWFEEDYWAQEEFPCELFLMDLDGVWGDSDGDGIYDSHTGDVAPEIWLGRIDAHAAAFGSELLMISEYLEKNHLYRTGAMAPPSRALTFIDDDWSGYTDCGLNSIYGSSGVTVVNSETQTTAANYLSRLAEGYEFVHLMAHSCPWGHTFKVPGGMAGTVMAPEIAQVNPNTAFLQLFSCSNARWVEEGCLGNWYLFGTDTGLLVSGAAKTGSMLDFEEFYGPIGSGYCFGEAFRSWWQYQAQGGFSGSERAWFYGNALLGDPTLRPVSSMVCDAGIETSGSSMGTAVSTSQHSDCFPDVAYSGGVTAVAWLTGENGRLDVSARFHDENGDSWSQVYVVDADEYWDNAVSVCFDQSTGEPWLAWSDFEYSTYSYRIKTAHGLPFDDVVVAAPQEGYQVAPDLACTDRMWLAWQDWESTGGRIMLKSLTQGAFSCQLSAVGEWAAAPSISAGPSGDLHAVWVLRKYNESAIMWASGDENGFSAPVQISFGQVCNSPHIALIDGTLIAAWQEDDLESSIIARTWNGTSWEPEVQVEKFSPHHLSNPVVCTAPGGEPAIYWQQGRSSAVPMVSLLSEGYWSTPFQPFSSSGPVWNPIAAGSRVFWAGNEDSGWDIFCAVPAGIGEEGGTPFQGSLQIAANPVRNALVLEYSGPDSPAVLAVSIYDLAGREVMRSETGPSLNDMFTVDCSNLPAGVYAASVQGAMEPVRFTLLR